MHTRTLTRLVLGPALAGALLACAESSNTRVCDPGEQQVCPCGSGGESVQVCSDNGARWQDCQCSAVSDTDVDEPDATDVDDDDGTRFDDVAQDPPPGDATDTTEPDAEDAPDASPDAADAPEIDVATDADIDAFPDAPIGPTLVTTIQEVQQADDSVLCILPEAIVRVANVVLTDVVIDSTVFAHPDGLDAFFAYDPPGGLFGEALFLLQPGVTAEFRKGDALNIEAEWREVDCETRLYVSSVERSGDGGQRERIYQSADPRELGERADLERLEELEGVLVNVRPEEEPFIFDVVDVDGLAVTVTPQRRLREVVLRMDIDPRMAEGIEVGDSIPGDVRGFGAWHDGRFTLMPRGGSDL